MRGLGEWLRGAGIFVLKNADAFLAMAVALAVIVALAVGRPSKEVVDAAILGVVGTMALALLRDRGGHGDLSDLRQLARDAISDRPYDVVWQNTHWDLKDERRAVCKRTEQIRFTRNDVATNFSWSSGDGTVESVNARWRRARGLPWIEARKVYEFRVRGGFKEIFCFDEEHSRGDILDWCIVQETLDRFATTHEGV